LGIWELTNITAALIKRKAKELGFDLCGIAPAGAFPELSFLREWLARGYAGEMRYMGRTADARADVRNVVPAARSVIVTGTIYTVDRPYSIEHSSREDALIARYAWGDDYHDVLKARLDALLSWMREASPEPFDARAYVDTGPVQERVYAQYAGLGWIGKNTCLINAEQGSWLFLSEIICSLPLEPDAPALDQCGTCTLCLEACPTGAITEPHVLDATRCLSYLTIELRGAIPEEHRTALGAHVYGCDICQEVCPYNQHPPRSNDAAWQPRRALDLPKLVDLWTRSDEELRHSTRGSAMTRAKLTGLRRNLAVAIGNSGDPDAIAALAVASEDRPSAEDPIVEEHIRWAITKYEGADARTDEPPN
jgi:epoxyqueuosine reductase